MILSSSPDSDFTIGEIDEKYYLSFSENDRNPYGISPIFAEIQVGTRKTFDAVTIFKPIFDFKDFGDSKNIKAELLEDGTGMIITEPVLPHFLLHSVNEIHQQEGTRTCLWTTREHSAQATSIIRGGDERRFKRTLLRFPTGVVCTLDIYNTHEERDSPNGLKTNCRFLFSWFQTGTPSIGLNGNMPVVNPYVFWKLVIKNSERLLHETPGSQLEHLNAAFVHAHIPPPPR